MKIIDGANPSDDIASENPGSDLTYSIWGLITHYQEECGLTYAEALTALAVNVHYAIVAAGGGDPEFTNTAAYYEMGAGFNFALDKIARSEGAKGLAQILRTEKA